MRARALILASVSAALACSPPAAAGGGCPSGAPPGLLAVSSSDGSPPRYVPSCAAAVVAGDWPPAAVAADGGRKRALEQGFVFDFTCLSNDTALCDKAKKGFESAGTSISKALAIKTAITVNATMRSFCGSAPSSSSCSLASVLGFGRPTNAFVYGAPANFFTVAQPHLKQIATQEILAKLPLAAYDIEAEFNTDYPWYFPGDDGPSPDQADFETTVVHELLHGIGFLDLYGVSELPGLEDVLLPPVDTDPDAIFTSFPPPAAFAANIFSTSGSESWVRLQRVVSNWSVPAGTKISDVPALFKASGAPYDAAKKLYALGTSGPNVLQVKIPRLLPTFPSGGSAILATFSTWKQGSSVYHLDQSYSDQNTSDFLMAPSAGVGESMQQQIAASDEPDWPYAPIGPRTLGVLAGMGWPTVLREVTNGTGSATTAATATASQTLAPTASADAATSTAPTASPSASASTTRPSASERMGRWRSGCMNALFGALALATMLLYAW
ncbi:hypothetical protein DFJ74DRAFT_695344 [Hyaloraphidium curvatum]|nr:hypothetical protein DFJ74DRAFT_695344 [Hyaloraphidium curvatum]